jgi:ELWxxDGT repeat protein
MRKKLPSESVNALNVLTDFARTGMIAFILFIISVTVKGQAELIMDINQGEETTYNEFSNLQSIDEKVFYVSEFKHLWIAWQDTDENNTDRAEKIASFEWIDRLYVAGSTLYFVADDGVHGRELWQTTGTVDGTFMVKDIYPGTASANPDKLTFSNGILYFSAASPGMGTELWRTNGSGAGTSLVKDILSQSGSSKPDFLTDVNGILFFTASDGTHGYELWRSDGSPAGTTMVSDIVPALKSGSTPRDLTNINGTLFFTAQESATGRELYKSNGTAAGTSRIKDIRPGTNSSGIENLTAMNGYAVFTATDGISGHELWRSDGTSSGTYLVKDMTPGAAGSHGETAFSYRMANFKVINGTLFYTAYQNNTYYIWKSNGTTTGTVTLFETSGPGIGQARPNFTEMDGKIYFFVEHYSGYDEEEYSLHRMNLDGSMRELVYFLYNDTYEYYYPSIAVVTNTIEQKQLYTFGETAFVGIKLLRSAGTEETTQVLYALDPLIITDSSDPYNYVPFRGKLAFIAESSHYEIRALMITDGVSATELALFQHMGSAEHAITTTGTHIYATGRDWLELYKTDGAAYTYGAIVDDHQQPPALILTGTSTHVYFTNVNGELWKIDGTTDGLTLLKTFHRIVEMRSLGTALVFRVVTSSNGEEWWRTNGTIAGTYRIKLMRANFATLPLRSPTAMVRGAYFFVSNNSTHGNEVWRTGGVGSNSYMLADLNTNDAASVQDGREYDISALAAFRDSLYISAKGSNGQWALFKSNGAAGNITKVIEMNAIRTMSPATGKLYLFVYGPDNKTGISLWVTNGTAGGTKLVKQFSYAAGITSHAVGGDLYFSLHDGTRLWKSDGTECGTMPLEVGEVQPFEVTGIGSTLVFTGYEFEVGREPYRYNTSLAPESPCSAQVADESFAAGRIMESMLKSYPNPFVSEATISVSGDNYTKAKISATTMTGHPVMPEKEIDANHDHKVGSDWASGMYLLKVTYNGKTETSIIVKK